MFSSFILPAVCPNMATLNETSGVLTSPYYPWTYPSSANCSWKITASKGERIVLVIEDISIWRCGSSYTCDYLQIENGSSSDGISGRRRCRYYKDRGIVYHSTKDVLRVTFVSKSFTHWGYRGLKATYIKVKYGAVTTGKFVTLGGRCLCRWSRDKLLSAKKLIILVPYVTLKATFTVKHILNYLNFKIILNFKLFKLFTIVSGMMFFFSKWLGTKLLYFFFIISICWKTVLICWILFYFASVFVCLYVSFYCVNWIGLS